MPRDSQDGRIGWQNRGYNYDGKIDGSDYTLIDNAFNTQTVSLAAQIATAAAPITSTATTVFSTTQIAAATAFAGDMDSEKPHRLIDDVGL